jgi:hypothetical protein
LGPLHLMSTVVLGGDYPLPYLKTGIFGIAIG